MTTERAPAWLVEIAASSAALPPPITMTSHDVLEGILRFSELTCWTGCPPRKRRDIRRRLLHEILVAQLRLWIGERALGHAEGHAHLCEADADRLGVEHLRAGRLGKIVGIDHVGNERAAERQ